MDISKHFEQDENQLTFPDLVAKLLTLGKTFGTAESCTGGMISAFITDVPGSSDWFKGGIVSYSNEIKEKMLGVSPNIINTYGAVSEETARAMAKGARLALEVDCTVAVTGIAGPGGGTPEKVVGTVCFAWDLNGELSSATKIFAGNRQKVRTESAYEALSGLLKRLENK